MKRVVIAENSAILKNYLKEILEKSQLFSVIKLTANGEDVVLTCSREIVDLVILGENISLMNEAETVQHILKEKSIPIILLNSNPQKPEVLQALKYGAAAVIPKPGFEELQNKSSVEKLVQVFYEHTKNWKKAFPNMPSLKGAHETAGGTNKHKALIVIGASTGGPPTLKEIFEALPKNFPVGIALVQHFEQGFEEGFASWLNQSSPLNIRIAKEIDFPEAGEVIIAPQKRHLIATKSSLVLQEGAKVNNQKPSVDLLFTSAAAIYKTKLLAVLLTGMGRDGAQGCLDVIQQGGHTVVQSRESCIVYGMPKEAILLNAASVVLDAQSIPEYLIRFVSNFI